YQNELSLEMGFKGDEERWLANFTNNSIEWFSQYNVWFSTGFQSYLEKAVEFLPGEISAAEEAIKSAREKGEATDTLLKVLTKKQESLKEAHYYREKYTKEKFAKLSQKAKN